MENGKAGKPNNISMEVLKRERHKMTPKLFNTIRGLKKIRYEWRSTLVLFIRTRETFKTIRITRGLNS